MNKVYLDHYVDIIVKIGLGIESGEDVVIWADVEAYEFTREVVKKCYERGAKDVLVNYYDQYADLEYMMKAPMEVLSTYPDYLFHTYAEKAKNGAAVLVIWSKVPNLTKDVNQERLSLFMKAFNKAKSPLWNLFMDGSVVRCIVACPFGEWAQTVYPDKDEELALEELWNNLFTFTRADRDDYLECWKKHIDTLEEKTRRLNELDIDTIHVKTDVTDLTIGFPEKFIWHSALLHKDNGTPYFVNIPSEEIFTSPHKYKVNGYVTSTKPLNYNSNMIEGIRFEIKEGKIIHYEAKVGEKVLESLLTIDENALYFGEIALVSKESVITKTDTVFNNILIDENASSHMAFGAGFPLCVKGSEQMTPEEKDAYGINLSKIHLDFMIGNETLCVEAHLKNKEVVQIMKDGAWTNF